MSVPIRYALHQGPVIRGMGQTIVSALKARAGLAKAGTPPLPGPLHTVTLPPRPAELVRAYVRHVGGDPAAYKDRLPAHLFPQWTFGLTGRVLDGVGYPLLAAMNAGCKLTLSAPLPAGEPLVVTGQLAAVDDDGRRAILDERFVTGTAGAPAAMEAHLYVYVPLGKGANGKGDGKGANGKAERPRVDAEARELAFWRLGRDAGLDFAKLTGDFNPVHWVPAWARAFGFKGTILHGFATLARAIEGLVRARFAGDVDALAEIEVRFTRPLVLPARVGLYVRGERLWVGDAPGGPAYLEGTFRPRGAHV